MKPASNYVHLTSSFLPPSHTCTFVLEHAMLKARITSGSTAARLSSRCATVRLVLDVVMPYFHADGVCTGSLTVAAEPLPQG